MIKYITIFDEQGKVNTIKFDIEYIGYGKPPIIITDDDYPDFDIELLELNGKKIENISQEYEDEIKGKIMLNLD